MSSLNCNENSLRFHFFVNKLSVSNNCISVTMWDRMLSGCTQRAVLSGSLWLTTDKFECPLRLDKTQIRTLHPSTDRDYWYRSRLPKWTMITAATLFIRDQLRSSSKSVELAKGILSFVLSAALQLEGRQVTLQKAATFTGNVHLRYTITTPLLYGVYIYIYII